MSKGGVCVEVDVDDGPGEDVGAGSGGPDSGAQGGDDSCDDGGDDGVIVLVTGGTGFVGRWVCRLLVRHDGFSRVRVLTRRVPSAASGKRDAGVEYIAGDVTRESDVAAALEGVHAVVHAAAEKPYVGTTKARFRKLNVDATQTLLDLCRASPTVRSFVYASSIGAVLDLRAPASELQRFGGSAPFPRDEFAGGLYGWSKRKAEENVTAAHDDALLRTCSLRIAGVLGPGDDAIYDEFATKKRPSMVGKGRNVVDFVDVESTALACVRALEALAVGPALGTPRRVYNVGSCLDPPQTLRDLVFAEEWAVFDRRSPAVVPRALLMALAAANDWLAVLLGFGVMHPLLSRAGVRNTTTSWYMDCSATQEDLGWAPVHASPQAAAKAFFQAQAGSEESEAQA